MEMLSLYIVLEYPEMRVHLKDDRNEQSQPYMLYLFYG